MTDREVMAIRITADIERVTEQIRQLGVQLSEAMAAGLTAIADAMDGVATEARTKREQAEDQARETLLALLTPRQRAQYRRYGSITFTGSHGTRYRIEKGTVYNVVWLTGPGNRAVGGRLCATPRGRLPTADIHLGQLLALRTDETAWLDMANLTSGDYPPTYYQWQDAELEQKLRRSVERIAGLRRGQVTLRGYWSNEAPGALFSRLQEARQLTFRRNSAGELTVTDDGVTWYGLNVADVIALGVDPTEIGLLIPGDSIVVTRR